MTLSIEKITSELKGLGYDPLCLDTPQRGKIVFINYLIEIGKYSGCRVRLGFSFKEEGYPEYPPHWIHISPPYDDQLGGAVETYTYADKEGIMRECLALSRPPGGLWDMLPAKHMKGYLDYHVTRFCSSLK